MRRFGTNLLHLEGEKEDGCIVDNNPPDLSPFTQFLTGLGFISQAETAFGPHFAFWTAFHLPKSGSNGEMRPKCGFGVTDESEAGWEAVNLSQIDASSSRAPTLIKGLGVERCRPIPTRVWE